MIFNVNDILKVYDYIPELVDRLEDAYVKYSTGKTNVPPVGLLHFDRPEGNSYIKYGHIEGDESFVIKIFNGWPENNKLGIPTSDGINLVFDVKTGMNKAVLMDQGCMTSIRTGAAAVLTTKYLAPKNVKKIGICGTGAVATAAMSMLHLSTDCKEVMVYDVWQKGIDKFVEKFTALGYHVVPTDLKTMCDECNLIISATTTHTPLFTADMIKPGTHITGIGADADGKNEIDASVFSKADIKVCDSRSQVEVDGDTSFAVKAGTVKIRDMLELGEIIKDDIRRENDEQITICDLTGLAIQDIVIAELVCDILTGKISK